MQLEVCAFVCQTEAELSVHERRHGAKENILNGIPGQDAEVYRLR